MGDAALLSVRNGYKASTTFGETWDRRIAPAWTWIASTTIKAILQTTVVGYLEKRTTETNVPIG